MFLSRAWNQKQVGFGLTRPDPEIVLEVLCWNLEGWLSGLKTVSQNHTPSVVSWSLSGL